MTSGTLHVLIAFLATLGVGSIVAATLSRWTVISNLRQAWIKALRDDLATYLKEIDAMHHKIDPTHRSLLTRPQDELLEKQRDIRGAALLVYRRILLRLNITEALHIQ